MIHHVKTLQASSKYLKLTISWNSGHQVLLIILSAYHCCKANQRDMEREMKMTKVRRDSKSKKRKLEDGTVAIGREQKRRRVNNENEVKNEASQSGQSSIEEETFESGRVMCIVCQYLQMNEIIKLRRVSKLFNDELYFKFDCKSFNIFFKYKNKYMIDIIDQQFGSLQSVTLYFFQMINLQYSGLVVAQSEESKDICERMMTEVNKWENLKQRHVMKFELCNLEQVRLTQLEIITPHFNIELLGSMGYENGTNCTIEIFKSIFTEVSWIDQNYIETWMDEYGNDNKDNDEHFLQLDSMLLGVFYKCKIMKCKLDQILNSKYYQDAIVTRPRTYVYGCLDFLWSSLGITERIFSHGYPTDQLKGKPHFLADCSAFGEFDIYAKYVKSMAPRGSLFWGLFPLFCMFLRDDLVKEFDCSRFTQDLDGKVFDCVASLLFVIQPQLLLHHKNVFENECMFILNEKEKFNFDLLNNERLHPLKRLSFLKLLTNSTHFMRALLIAVGTDLTYMYEDLKDTINTFRVSFDVFASDWMLSSYPDLVNNIEKQKEIYDDFMYHLQFLFTIGTFFCTEKNMDVDGWIPLTIFDENINDICGSDHVNLKLEYSMIDLKDDLVTTEEGLDYLYEAMKAGYEKTDEEMGDMMQHLYCEDLRGYYLGQAISLMNNDQLTFEEVEEEATNWMYSRQQVKDCMIEFDEIIDVKQFMRRKWNL